ncbi:MFS transporter [Actinacidiphila oryziradicis]|uniref:MFS transporter n=1 Tax=Actinacidiphila oryziradicis TaxID=2571141 RepID=A0A4U0SM18_9ACTN|nr:MFS transporter [Actinacidiphila oryziradicis]TKA10706.1 MFS transporter [Actinacidiphila oryziradicis]
MPATVVTAHLPLKPAHRDGNVLRWLTAYAASLIGDNVYFLALSWAAAQAGSPTQAGVVLAVGSVPRALLMLGGGVVADRFGPRRVVIGSDLTRCVVILAVAGLLAIATPGLWLLVTVALVFGVVDALFMPAVGALPPQITTSDQLGRIQGLKGVASRVGTVAGSSLGGIAVATGGSATAFAVAGVLFAVSLGLLLAVRIAPLPAGGPDDSEAAGSTAWRDLADGLRYIRRDRVLAPLVVVFTVGELGFAGPLNIGVTLLANERGWGAAGLGWIVSGFGLGAGAASVLLAVRGTLPRAGLVQAACLVPAAVAVAALAYLPSLPAAVVMGAVVGLAGGLAGALGGALLQTVADPAYLGRVSSVVMFFAVGTAPLTYPLTGAAIAAWGPAPVFTASAAVIAAGALLGLASSPLRRAELPGTGL